MTILSPLLLLLRNSYSLKKALTPGLVSSIVLSLSFIIVRKLTPVCQYLPSENKNGCLFDWVSVFVILCSNKVEFIHNVVLYNAYNVTFCLVPPESFNFFMH